jgi:Ca-activated chloride channel family protein
LRENLTILGTELAPSLFVDPPSGEDRSGDAMAVSAQAGLVASLMAVSQLIAGAQGPSFKTRTELVNLNVTVVGPDAHHVMGLTREQFEVFEDGVRQEVKFFAPGNLPLDVVILLDMSASMTASLPLVQQAATRLVTALRREDRATIMGISGGLRVLETLTSDHPALIRAIQSAKVGGRTPLYASIYTALRELEKVGRAYDAPRRQAIVVLSDGQDTASGFGFDELLSTVRRQAVPIYTIAPRPSKAIRAQRESIFGESTGEQDFELRKLATETGARAFFPVALHELSGVYDDIAIELAHQYSLGYQSSNPKHDGSFRQISLHVRSPGVKWRTRAGYQVEGTSSAGF